MILRFEEFTFTQIASLRDSREEDYIWEDVVGKKGYLVDGRCNSCRQLFSDSEKHVMISEAKDWTNSSIRNLSF